MELFQIIGSIFQTPSPLPMAGGKGASVPRAKPEEGFLSGMFTIDGRSCDSKLSKDNIGSPCNFKHVAHIGWNSRFNCTVNSDLQLLFRKAGIGEEHLKDRRTSKKIFEIIERKGGMKAVREEAIGIDVPAESSSICSALQKLSAEISEQPMETSVYSLISNKGTSIDTVLPSLPPGHFAEVGFGPIRPQRRLRPFSRNPTKGPPPPLINCTLVDSLSIPPPPPLPPFLHTTSVVSAPVPLPSPLKYSAYDSTNLLPHPPPRVQFSRIQTSGLSAQPCIPPPLSNCMSVDSVISPPPPPLPPFLKKSIDPVPEQPPNCFGMEAVSILPSPLLLPFNSQMAVVYVPLQASQVQSVVQIDLCAVPPSVSSFQTVQQLHPPSNFNTLQSPLPTNSPVPVISSPLPTGNVLAHDSKVPPAPLHPPKPERRTKHQQVGNLDSSSEMGNGKQMAFMEQPSLLDEIRKGIRLKSAHVDVMVAHPVPEPISENKGFGAALEEAVRHGPKALRNSYASAGLNPNGSTLEKISILEHPIGTPVHQAPPSNNCSSVLPSLPSDGCAAVSVPIPPPPPLPSFLKTAIVSIPVTLPPLLNCVSVNSVALPPPPAPPLPPSFKTNRSLVTVPPPMSHDCNLLTDSNAVPPLPKCNNSSNTRMLVQPQLPCNVNASQSTLPTCSPVLVPSALPIRNSLAPNSMLPPAAPIPTKPARPNKPRSLGSLMISRETNVEKQTPPTEQPNLMDEIRKGIHLKSTVLKLKVPEVAAPGPSPTSEDKALGAVLRDALQKRHKALQSSCDEHEDGRDWED